jgi:hypothetical protein
MNRTECPQMSRTGILFIIWFVISALWVLIAGTDLDELMNSGVATPDEEVLKYSLYVLFVPPVLLAVPFVAIDWILKQIDWILNVSRRPRGLTGSSSNADISLEENDTASSSSKDDALLGSSEKETKIPERYIDSVTPTPSAKDRADPFKNSVVQRAETSKLKSVIKVGFGVFIVIVFWMLVLPLI